MGNDIEEIEAMMDEFSHSDDIENNNDCVKTCTGCRCSYRTVKFFSAIFSTILTVFDLFGLIYVLSFILHFVMLIGLRVTENEFDRNTGYAFMLITGLLLSNTLFIPLWLFTRFSYFYASPFFNIQTIIAALIPCADTSEYVTCRTNSKSILVIKDVFFTLLLLIYLILFVFLTNNFDNMTFLLMVIIPSFKYLSALVLYGFNAWMGLFIEDVDQDVINNYKRRYDTYFNIFIQRNQSSLG